MRCIFGRLLLLAALGSLAVELLPPVPAAPAAEDSGWRRTRDGWQWITSSETPIEGTEPRLHPTVVALLELLLVVTALVAFPPSRLRRPPRDPETTGRAAGRQGSQTLNR